MNSTIARQPGHERNSALDHLRAFIIVLVVAHHAVLAYHPYAPPPGAFSAENLIWGAFPIVDAQRWAGTDLFVGFNDAFFMSLMFFLSGLFVWQTLQRKGARGFLRDRVWRLGVPFIVSAAILAPLAYYPAWLQRGGSGGVSEFAHAWLSLGVWPAGPAWFLWVLLVFDALAVLACRSRTRQVRIEAAGHWLASRTPGIFFVSLVAVGSAAFIPLALIVDPSYWSSFGPFSVQTSRILLYASFFAIGIAMGACDIERGVLSTQGALARRWLLWPHAALGAYFVLVALFITLLITSSQHEPIPGLETATLIAFVVSCVASCLAFLSVFLRFSKEGSAVFDSFRRNAYGIYIVHYAFVSWLQFSLLGSTWPGAVKGSAVFVGALALSWLTVAALRRIPAIARVVAPETAPRGTQWLRQQACDS